MLKFHTIARYQLVSIFKKCKPQSEMGVVDPGALPGVPATPTPSNTPSIPPPAPPTPVPTANSQPTTPFDRPGEKEDKQTFQVSDCRSLVKTLVCGVKTITWGITSCKAPGGEKECLMPNNHWFIFISTLNVSHTNTAAKKCLRVLPNLFFFASSRGSIYPQQAASAKGDADIH